MTPTNTARPRARILTAVLCLLLAQGVPVLGQSSGQAQTEGIKVTVFTNRGAKFVGEFEDISAPRSVLQLKSGREIRLKSIWMINFLDRTWSFPEELKRIEKDENTLFLKDDTIVTGRILDYNDRLRAFELDGGRTVGIDKVKRIYFTKTIPKRLARILKRREKK